MDNIAVVRGREDLLAQLREEQEKSNYISEQFIKQTAQTMGLSVSDVYARVFPAISRVQRLLSRLSRPS
jgi:NADH:ubiquinone oxidoreductase subunit E